MVPIIYKGKNMSYIERITSENKELIEKVYKLGVFMKTSTFAELDLEDRLLLGDQYVAMEKYSSILDARMMRA
jgi:hypothetical protein